MSYLADALCFLGLQGAPPVMDPALRLDLAHVTSVAPPDVPPNAIATQDILRLHNEFKECVLKQEGLYPVTDALDLGRVGTGVIFGLQSPPYDCNEKSVELLYEAGVRIMQLAYREDSPYGGDPWSIDKDLSEAGRKLILFCLQHKMIVDLSHLNHRTARSVLDVAPGRIFVSHTGCWDVYRKYPNQHPSANWRNFPDDVLRDIVKKGGVVGIYTLTFPLHPEDDSTEPFFAHLGHAIDVCGEDAVVIGSDGVYTYKDPEIAAKQFQFMKSKLDPNDKMGARMPDHPAFLNSPRRMEYLFEAISERYSVTIAEKICGRNLFRFFVENL